MFGRGGHVVPWFKCPVSGENFPGVLIGQQMPLGFYTTRFIEAIDADSAEVIALQSLRADPDLAPPRGFTATGQAKLYVQEIEEIGAHEVPAVQPGIVWYPMDNGDSSEGSG